MDLVWLDVAKCKPNSYNPNVMNKEKFDALCDFLKTHSAEELDPIWVRNDGVGSFEIIDGEHRWKAAREVGWKRLKGFITALDVNSSKALNVRKNRERGRLDVFKLGKLMSEDRDKGLTCDEINTKYGYISQGGARASEYIQIYKNKDLILANVPTGTKLLYIPGFCDSNH